MKSGEFEKADATSGFTIKRVKVMKRSTTIEGVRRLESQQTVR
jgi:hypothetical protein